VQEQLLWNVDRAKADEICCFNRHYAEHSGYFATRSVTWVADVKADSSARVYYDSVHGRPIFKAPVGRSLAQFLEESSHHGWPSFRDDEVDWTYVRVLPGGEVVTTDGVHLGHNVRAARGAGLPTFSSVILTNVVFLSFSWPAPRRQEPLLHQPRLYVLQPACYLGTSLDLSLNSTANLLVSFHCLTALSVARTRKRHCGQACLGRSGEATLSEREMSTPALASCKLAYVRQHASKRRSSTAGKPAGRVCLALKTPGIAQPSVSHQHLGSVSSSSRK
jgi:hypothetical protein